jgi:hypothetical protein
VLTGLLEGTVAINVVSALVDYRVEKQTVYVLEGVWMDGELPTVTKVSYNKIL